MLIVGAAAVAVIAVAAAVWMAMRPSGSTEGSAASPAAPPGSSAAAPVQTNSTPTPTDPADRVLAMLPTGYSEGACAPAPADVEHAQLAVINCARNDDTGGPSSATYTLMGDPDALASAFSDIVAGIEVVTCPGEKQSPGPWKKSGAPESGGMIVCAMRPDRMTLAWTDDARMLLAVIHSDTPEATLSDLYAWWGAHSSG